MYILDELYAGNVNPSEHAFQKDDPYAKAMDLFRNARLRSIRQTHSIPFRLGSSWVSASCWMPCPWNRETKNPKRPAQAAAPAQAGLFFWMKSRSSLGCSALRSYRKHSGRNTPTLAGGEPLTPMFAPAG